VTEREARIPPHNLDAERAVLGAPLHDAATLGRVLGLADGDFYLEAHRVVLGRMRAMAEAGHAVTLLTLADALDQAGQLQAAGGPALLAQLDLEASIETRLDEYIRIVRRNGAKREQIQVLTRALSEAYNGTDPTKLAGDLGQRLDAIVLRADPDGSRAPARPQGLGEVLAGVMRGLDSPETDYVPSPIPELNDRLGGGQLRGELCYLGGRPGVAKTALALQWAVLAAERGCPTLVVSREMRNAALGQRILAQQTQVPATALRRRDLREDERRRIERALPRLGRLPLWIDDGAATIGQIRRLVRTLRPRFLVVDYVQLVRSPEEAKASRRLEVTAVSAGLKDLAMRWGGRSVLALSSLRRLGKERGRPLPPTLDDLKESGDLEADADLVLVLHQPREDSTDRELSFAKLRGGETGGRVTLDWTPVFVRFTQVDDPREPGANDVPF